MRRALVALVLGLMVGISVPVMADHITEPTAPIQAIDLRLFSYQLGTASTLTACDGSETVNWDAVRIEADVTAQAVPSEHYQFRVLVERVINENRDSRRREWDAIWNHQNIPPHHNRRFESIQANTYTLFEFPGLWVVTVKVIGDESGLVFEDVCKFRRG